MLLLIHKESVEKSIEMDSHTNFWGTVKEAVFQYSNTSSVSLKPSLSLQICSFGCCHTVECQYVPREQIWLNIGGVRGGGAVSIFVFFNYPQLCKVACHLLKSNTSKSNSQAPLPLITELSGLAISLVCKIICKSNHTDKPFTQAKSYYLLSYRKTKTLEKEKRGEKKKEKKKVYLILLGLFLTSFQEEWNILLS